MSFTAATNTTNPCQLLPRIIGRAGGTFQKREFKILINVCGGTRESGGQCADYIKLKLIEIFIILIKQMGIFLIFISNKNRNGSNPFAVAVPL